MAGQNAAKPPETLSMDEALADETPQNTVPKQSMMQTIGQGAKDFGKGLLESGVNTLHGIGSAEHALMPQGLRSTGYGKNFEAGLDTMADAAKPEGWMQTIGKGLGDVGQFFIPGGAEEEAAAHLVPMMGKFGGLAKPLMRMAGGEAVNEAEGGPKGAGAAGAGVGEGMAAGMKSLAPFAYETALRIPAMDRGFGRNIGQVGLEETKGVLPSTIRKSAQDSVSRLGAETEAAAKASPNTASLRPARQGLQDWLGQRSTQQSPTLYDQVNGMHEGLETVPRGPQAGAAIPDDVPAEDMLAIKRGFSDEHLGKWNPNVHEKATAAGRQAYGRMADEFHTAVPEAADADRRVSSLIPTLRATDKAERAPSLFQRTAGRIGAHTGALTGAVGGALEGQRLGGTPGALVGGAAGLLLPELLMSPESQMMAARTMASTGVQNAAPHAMAGGVSKGTSALMDFLRRNKGAE